METQTPKHEYTVLNGLGASGAEPAAKKPDPQSDEDPPPVPPVPPVNDEPANTESGLWIEQAGYQQPIAAQAPLAQGAADPEFGFPPDWPDPNGFIPPPPRVEPQACCPSDKPVLRHTQAYNGHDPEFTEALATYYFFRDDARFGGWQTYMERSDDFIRFCCHMHIWEMLSARGGAGETRVVWRWPEFR